MLHVHVHVLYVCYTLEYVFNLLHLFVDKPHYDKLIIYMYKYVIGMANNKPTNNKLIIGLDNCLHVYTISFIRMLYHEGMYQQLHSVQR